MKTVKECITRVDGPNKLVPDLDEVIAKHPFLEGLSPHQARILRDCAMFMHYQAGEVVFREGDPANRFYLLLNGKISLEAHILGNGLTPLQVVNGGEVLGWSWMFPPYFWHFDARAIEDTDTVFFYATPLREECEADHDLGFEMVKRVSKVMLERLQATRRQLAAAIAN
jgi:CRP-like cAMP-binding protein